MGKASIFEESSLPGAVAILPGWVPGKLPPPGCLRARTPIRIGEHHGVAGKGVFHPALAKLLTNAHRPVTAASSRLGILLRESLIRERAIVLQVIEHRHDLLRVEVVPGELSAQLLARMLAPSQELERLAANLLAAPGVRATAARFAQASTSASSASSVAGGDSTLGGVSTLARSSASSLSETSGCSFRYWRTLSRPWPMRSPA